MSGTRTTIHFISVLIMLIWSAVLLYFHASGRVNAYLPPDGIFRDMVLIAGVGMAVVALFNLFTTQAGDGGCASNGCDHDHGPEGHDHAHDHDHGHVHTKDCGHDHGHVHTKDCGHDHGHGHVHTKDCGHDHDHGHVHTKDCGHDHDHGHVHTKDCGHDHTHDHGHAHGHSHDHGHGILEESSWIVRIWAILMLIAPLTWAAFKTPDRFSANAVTNKGLYDPNYQDQTNSDKFDLRKTKPGAAPSVVAAVSPTQSDNSPSAATGKVERAAPAPTPMPDGALPPPAQFDKPEAVAKASPPPPDKARSVASFTLEDLKKQVPQSKEGNFILEVPELYYTGGDLEVQRVITGQPVETVAQVLPEKVNNADGHRLRIFRLMVQCCAADARPYSIPVDFGKKAPEFKDMSWVKVTGKMSFKKEGDQVVPIIEATSIEETPAPADAMIY